MCLYKKSYIPRIALRDITTYKVVYNYSTSDEDTFYTCYIDNPIKLNQTYTGKFEQFHIYGLLKSFFKENISDGFIHSYSEVHTAYLCKYNFMCYHPYNYKIVECVIPAGTLYFIGRYNEIASRRLKYIKTI